MPVFAPVIWILVLVVASTAAAQEPQRLSAADVSPAVRGVLVTPKEPGPHAAVVLLPGSSGWKPAYAAIATRLAESGFVALALDYYGESGPPPEGGGDRAEKWAAWQETVRHAVAHLHTLPAVSDKPVGLVGYSLGAFLAVSVASSTPTVRAVDTPSTRRGVRTTPNRSPRTRMAACSAS